MEAVPTSALWQSILSSVERKIGPRACNTWVKPAHVKGLDRGVLKLSVPNPFFVEWIGEHYLHCLNESAAEALGRPVKVELVVDEELRQTLGPVKTEPRSAAPSQACEESGHPRCRAGANGTLNPNYTFEDFVVGPNNQLASAASTAVARKPGAAYNPLFIYGGSGLGKTHMLHAIGNEALRAATCEQVCYVSAERFMNELILAIQQGTTLAFRNKFRRAQLLLIDDVHFLSGKESTQEEFFHTFNSLHEAGRQIVLTSDRPPKEISRVEDRLISRFTWGLVVDIQKPDLETRVAILHKKAARQGLSLSPEVALTMAKLADGNIRELEGSLLRVKAYSQLTGRRITPELVGEVLAEIYSRKRNATTILDVQRVVAEHFGLRPDELRSKRRTNAVAFPRQVAMYICRNCLDAPLAEIGEKFGGRDHTTVLYACSKVEMQIKTDPRVKSLVTALSERSLASVQN